MTSGLPNVNNRGFMAKISDKDEIVDIYLKYQKSLLRLAMTYVDRSYLAEDIVGDTIIAVLERPLEFENEASCACYMRQTVRNKSISLLRRKYQIGRAWVVAAYNAIVEVVDGILYIRTDEKTDISRDEPTIESIEDTITYFDSVSDAVEQIDEPILCFQNDVAELVSMRKVISPVKGLVVESEYSLSDHINITIKQEWGNSHVGSIVTDDTKAHVRIVLPDGLIIDGVYANDDMSFVGVAVTGETIIHVCIMNIPSTDKIQEVLSLTEIR